MSLADRRWLRIFTLCALYVAQGMPWGFMATTLPAYLTKQKIDFAFVATIQAFTTLPFAFKWVWGPIIDTFTVPKLGRRRPWIIFAQAMMAVTVITLVALDITQELKLLAWMILIHTVFNALQDVATDALAVDILPEDERGSANGLMYGAKYAGGALGGAGMAMMIAWTDLDTALLAQTAILVVIMLVPLLVRESASPPPAREPFRVVIGALMQAFSLRSTIVAALLMLSMNFAIGMIAATGNPLFIGTLKWSVEDYAGLVGGWALLIGGVFAANGGYLTDRFGRRRVAMIASCALAAGWVVFALLRDSWTDKTLVYAFGFYATACMATLSVALIAMCMDLSWPRIAASQFTTYMALSNFSTTLGSLFAPYANEWWEFEYVYIVAAAIQVTITLLLWPIDPLETRNKLPLPEGKRLNVLGLGPLILLLLFLIGMTAYVTWQKLG